jgi:hypothetical protein
MNAVWHEILTPILALAGIGGTLGGVYIGHPRDRKRVLPLPPHHGTKEENLIQMGPDFAVDLLLLRYAPEKQIEPHQLIPKWGQYSPAQWGQVSLTNAARRHERK